MGAYYDYLKSRDLIEPPGDAILWVTGDSHIPLVSALLNLRDKAPEMLDGLVAVVSQEGEDLGLYEARHFRPPYMKALVDISLFLRDNGYEDASKFLSCGLDLEAEAVKRHKPSYW